LKKSEKNRDKVYCGSTGGSGWVAVVPKDAHGCCGHFGAEFKEIGA
jgi:hypothetical protein